MSNVLARVSLSPVGLCSAGAPLIALGWAVVFGLPLIVFIAALF
jgi:hypothetical protein